MQVRWWGCAKGTFRRISVAGAAVCAAVMLFSGMAVGRASHHQASATASAPYVVSPFFEVAQWRLGARRKLVRLRVLGVRSGERVITACTSCGRAGFTQKWGVNRMTLIARHPVRMVARTRIIVGTTAPGATGRWLVIEYSHGGYRGAGHGCMPSGVTSLSAASAANPAGIPRASCAGPCPSPVGTEYVDWRGTDGQLYEIPFNGSSWGGALPIGSGEIHSAPDVVVRAGGQRDVFWEGSDHKLVEMWYGGFWNGPVELRGAGRLRSVPAAVVDAHGVEHVFWKGGNGWLWELSDPGGVWSSSYPVDSGHVGSAPAVVSNPIAGLDVFWKGTGGKLWEIRDSNGWGFARPLSGAGRIGSGPTAVSDTAGVDHVFWRGTNGYLWEISDPGGRWGVSIPLNSGRMGSAPSALIRPDGEIDVFWKGTDGRLRELQSSGTGWREPIKLSGGGELGSRPSAAAGRCQR